MSSQSITRFIDQYMERIHREYDEGKYTDVEYRMRFVEPVNNDIVRSATHSVRTGNQSSPYVMYSPFSENGRRARIYVNLKGWNTYEIQREVLNHLMDTLKPYQVRVKVSYRA